MVSSSHLAQSSIASFFVLPCIYATPDFWILGHFGVWAILEKFLSYQLKVSLDHQTGKFLLAGSWEISNIQRNDILQALFPS